MDIWLRCAMFSFFVNTRICLAQGCLILDQINKNHRDMRSTDRLVKLLVAWTDWLKATKLYVFSIMFRETGKSGKSAASGSKVKPCSQLRPPGKY